MRTLLKKTSSNPLVFLAAISFFFTFITAAGVSLGADSGCVTCHLDKEMLMNTVAAQKGKKSAMQSGAG